MGRKKRDRTEHVPWEGERTLAAAEEEAREAELQPEDSPVREPQPGQESQESHAPESPSLESLPQDTPRKPNSGGANVRCACGSDHFVLEGFFAVENGVVNPVPVEAERLTCPECGREYEPIVGEGRRILRGDFIGQFNVDD